MTATPLLVDIEKLVSAFLRGRSEVTALVSDRVYTELPQKPTFPAVRVFRWGGAPVMSRPLHLDSASLQFDVWGGPKRTAWLIAETIRSVMHDLPGPHADGVVSGVRFGSLAWLPDSSFEPARPRYMLTAEVRAHP